MRGMNAERKEMEVQRFDSIEEMFDSIQKGVQQAKARATAEQNAITYGDYWFRFWPEGELAIFGYIMTEDELYSSSAYDDALPEEIAYEKEAAKKNYANGFRFGRAYSVVVDYGELGDTHVSTMTKISKEMFEVAKLYRWDFAKLIHEIVRLTTVVAKSER